MERLIPLRSHAPVPFVPPLPIAESEGRLPGALFTLADELSERALVLQPSLGRSARALVTGGMAGHLRDGLASAREAHPVTRGDDPLALLLAIAVVVAGAVRPLSTPTGSAWANARTLLASLRTVDRAWRTPFSATQVALDGGVGVCRDYALAVQTLFWVAQREWGLHPGARVVTAFGQSTFRVRWGHAWTWLFERDRRRVVALDLMQAVARVAQGHAPHVLTPSALDGSAHNNVSSLLATIYVWLETPDLPRSFHRAANAFARSLDSPKTAAGAELAHHLLQQRGLGREPHRRLRQALRRAGYEARRPGWEAALDEERRSLRGLVPVEDTPARRAFVDALLR